MPTSYSYKVRVLAALDAHYTPSRPTTPIPLRSIDSTYESDCRANRLFLLSTWRKRVKIVLDKLVAENWLIERKGSYTLTPRLRTVIADEKLRHNVNQRNHEWRVFASVAKRMETGPASNTGNAAPSSTPAGRTRTRTSLSIVEMRSPAQAGTPALSGQNKNSIGTAAPEVVIFSSPASRTRNRTSLAGIVEDNNGALVSALDVITVRPQSSGGRKSRVSDPGPPLSRSGPASSTPNTRKRRPSGGSAAPVRATPTVSRRRSIVPTRPNRRHTLAVAPTQRFTFPETAVPVSKQIQFYPLKQTLSARTRRALRRNALSEEMNDIDAEKRAGQKKNRELLAKLRAELAESSERLKELERELAAARFAPSVEPEELAPINEEQDDGDYDMGYSRVDSPEDLAPITPSRRSPPSVNVAQVEQTPSSHRDQKIRELELMIEALRQDIARRAEEERIRAQEDEVFHDAEEQILHEENHALAERIEELTALRGKTVSFQDDIEDTNQEDDEEEYMGPLADDFDDDVTDIEEHPKHATHSSFGVDSGIGTSTQQTVEVGLQNERIAELEDQNSRLQRAIDTLNGTIREMEENLEETHLSLAERKKAQDRLKKENEKLKRLEKELEEKVTELEEMEGERLENVGHKVIQTDDVVDQEKLEMEQQMDDLTGQVAELQEMIRVVTEEKKDAHAKIATTDVQIAALQSAADAAEVAKSEAEAQIRALTIQISELEDSILEDKREIEHTAEMAHVQITNLQEAKESNEAAKIGAQAQIHTLTNQIKDLGATTTEERERAKAQIVEMQELIESAGAAQDESQTQIQSLENEVREIRELAEKEQSDAKSQISAAYAQIAELEDTIESSQASIAEAESQIRALERRISDLESDASTFEAEKDELQQEIDILNRQVESLQEELEELREDNQELKQELEGIRDESRRFEEVAETLKHDKASLEENVESLEEKVQELETLTEDLTKAKAALEVDYTNLNLQLISQKNAMDLAEQVNARFQKDIAELRAQIESIEKEAETSRSQKESFERDIISLQAQVSSLESERKLSGDQNQDLQGQLYELSTQIASFEQAIQELNERKDLHENTIDDLRAQIETLQRAGKVAEQEKESLEQDIDDLKSQLAEVTEELLASRAENDLSKQDTENCKSEILRLNELLGIANRDGDDLRQEVNQLSEMVESLEGAFKGSNEKNRGLEHNIKTLQLQITKFEQASVIADEEKSIIQQKIRPYIHGEQSLDMAVDEVLTELVMAKNRADENERLRTELSNKIRILAQDDEESDSDSINPEEIVEKLTDRFREVRQSVEELYLLCGKSQESPFEGRNLEEFSGTGSNGDALTMLGSLVEALYQKVNDAQDRASRLREDYQRERDQSRLYGSYLEDVAMAIDGEGHLKKQIEDAEERVEELNQAVVRKDNTIRDMEADIDSAKRKETELNQKIASSIAAHNLTTSRLSNAQTEIHALSQTIRNKENDIERLQATAQEQADKEQELLGTIEQQTIEHSKAVRELKHQRDEAVNQLQQRLSDALESKAKVEHHFSQAKEENALIVKTLQDVLAATRGELGETKKELDAKKASYQQTIEALEGRAAQSKGEIVELSRKLREQEEKTRQEILVLESKLKSSSEEVERQVSALRRAESQRDKVANQLNSEIESNQHAISVLEKKMHKIITDAKIQQDGDRKAVSGLNAQLRTVENTAEEERRALQENISSQMDEVNQLTGRIEELEALLEEVEESERSLDEQLKVTESQSQLFKEEADKAQGALMAEKRALLQELAELKSKYGFAEEKMRGDITTLEALVEDKSQRISELENVLSILRGEKSKLIDNINGLKEENTTLEDMLDTERKKGAEAVSSLANEAEKFMARFGDVKNQCTRASKLREGLSNKRKRAIEEQEDEEGGPSRMPPTPASSVVTGTGGFKKLESKRRRYDSGIGVDEEDEEFEGVSAVGV
ncbi:uncharacterized protein LAJ45_11599 [Morchella importuna]|uniref:uncharacterized protein n=1 Tax=Morchella importuna TaxID=1174673 RepID=UPI001E8EDDA3|nr:uncharacterized protein LAJ45_11599 [Morchella importuna]KAH8144431.1 hypothetical protein LAJ45_11599 [Morchella importuna]